MVSNYTKSFTHLTNITKGKVLIVKAYLDMSSLDPTSLTVLVGRI